MSWFDRAVARAGIDLKQREEEPVQGNDNSLVQGLLGKLSELGKGWGSNVEDVYNNSPMYADFRGVGEAWDKTDFKDPAGYYDNNTYAGSFGNAAVGNAAGVVGGVADLLGMEKLGNKMNDIVQGTHDPNEVEAGFNLDYITSPHGLARSTGNVIGSMATIAPFTALVPEAAASTAATKLLQIAGRLGGNKGVQYLIDSGHPQLAKVFAERLGSYLPSGIAWGATSAPIESMAEGGGVVRQAKEAGLDNPYGRGWATAAENLPGLFLSNVGEGMVLRGAFKPAPGASALRRAASVPVTAGVESTQNAGEEAYQQIIQNLNTDRPLSEGVSNAALEGFFGSLLLGGAGGALHAVRNKPGETDTQEFKDWTAGAPAGQDYSNIPMPTQGADIDEQVANLKDGWNDVIPQIGGILKNKFGMDGVISSGARSAEHNAEVGGAENSYHIQRADGGDALDIVLPDGTTQEQADAIEQYFKDSGMFEEVLFHDAGSGYHLHLGGLKGGKLPNSAGDMSNFNDKQREAWKEAQWVQSQTGIPAEFIYRQWAHESGNFTSRLAQENNNFGGLTQSEPNGEENKQPDGGNYYRMFDNMHEYAQSYVNDFINRYDGKENVKTLEDFANFLHDNGYYTDSPENYIAGMRGVEVPSGDVDMGGPITSSTRQEEAKVDTYDDVYEQFAREQMETATDAEEVDYFSGFFNSKGKFKDTPENRQKLEQDYGEELKQFAEAKAAQAPTPKAQPQETQIERQTENLDKLKAKLGKFKGRAIKRKDFNTAMQINKAVQTNDVPAMQNLVNQLEGTQQTPSQNAPQPAQQTEQAQPIQVPAQANEAPQNEAQQTSEPVRTARPVEPQPRSEYQQLTDSVAKLIDIDLAAGNNEAAQEKYNAIINHDTAAMQGFVDNVRQQVSDTLQKLETATGEIAAGRHSKEARMAQGRAIMQLLNMPEARALGLQESLPQDIGARLKRGDRNAIQQAREVLQRSGMQLIGRQAAAPIERRNDNGNQSTESAQTQAVQPTPAVNQNQNAEPEQTQERPEVTQEPKRESKTVREFRRKAGRILDSYREDEITHEEAEKKLNNLARKASRGAKDATARQEVANALSEYKAQLDQTRQEKQGTTAQTTKPVEAPAQAEPAQRETLEETSRTASTPVQQETTAQVEEPTQGEKPAQSEAEPAPNEGGEKSAQNATVEGNSTVANEEKLKKDYSSMSLDELKAERQKWIDEEVARWKKNPGGKGSNNGLIYSEYDSVTGKPTGEVTGRTSESLNPDWYQWAYKRNGNQKPAKRDYPMFADEYLRNTQEYDELVNEIERREAEAKSKTESKQENAVAEEIKGITFTFGGKVKESQYETVYTVEMDKKPSKPALDKLLEGNHHGRTHGSKAIKFNSIEDANKFLSQVEKDYGAKAIRQADKYNGFLKDMSPVAQAKTDKALSKVEEYKGKATPRGKIVEDIIANGGHADKRGNSYRIYTANDTYVDATKVEYDYAKFLENMRTTEAQANTKTEPTKQPSEAEMLAEDDYKAEEPAQEEPAEEKKPAQESIFGDEAENEKDLLEALGITEDETEEVSFGNEFGDTTDEEIEALKKELQKELSKLSANPVFNPRIYTLGLQLGGKYIQKGYRTFKKWLEKMTSDLGEPIEPWAPAIWETLKTYPKGQKFDPKQIMAFSKLIGSKFERGVTSLEDVNADMKKLLKGRYKEFAPMTAQDKAKSTNGKKYVLPAEGVKGNKTSYMAVVNDAEDVTSDDVKELAKTYRGKYIPETDSFVFDFKEERDDFIRAANDLLAKSKNPPELRDSYPAEIDGTPITIHSDGRITGKTYDIKDTIKENGGKWDRDSRIWRINDPAKLTKFINKYNTEGVQVDEQEEDTSTAFNVKESDGQYIANVKDKLEYDAYKDVLKLAKKHGGDYKKGKGFVFDNEADLNEFVEVADALLGMGDAKYSKGKEKLRNLLRSMTFPKDSELTSQEQEIVNFGKQLGVKVVWFDGNPNLHGFHQNNITFLNRRSVKDVQTTFYHETFHWLKNNNPAFYQELLASIEKAGVFTQEQLDAYREKTGRYDLSNSDAIEEMLADEFIKPASRHEVLGKLAKQNKGVVERLVTWMKRVIDRIASVFHNQQGKLTTAQRDAFVKSFNKMAASLRDQNGRQIFTVNRNEITLQNGKPLATQEVSNTSDEVKFSADLGDSEKSFLDKLAGKFGRKVDSRIQTTQTEAPKGIGLFSYYLGSPSRIAEKVKSFKPFYTMADKAMNLITKNRTDFMRKYEKAWELCKKREEKDKLSEILLLGDSEEKEFTREEILAEGGSENVAKAYETLRRLTRKAYNLVNEARKKPKPHSRRLTDDEIAKLRENKFIQIQKITPAEDGRKLVTYKEFANWQKEYDVTPEELARFQADDTIQILESHENKDGTTHVKVREGIGDLTNRKGYIPHIFHEYMVRVKDKDGNVVEDYGYGGVLTSGRNEKEAVAKAEEWLKDNKLKDGETIYVAPKVFNFNTLGMSEKDYGVIMGDKDYDTMMESIADNNEMTLKEVKDMLGGSVRKKNRHRFFGHVLKRQGAKGYEEDMQWALRHYFNSAIRYHAMETEFKPQAISLFERFFGDFDKKHTGIAAYTQDFINDINGNPTQLELWINDTLNRIPAWRKFVVASYGDRAALKAANSVTNLMSHLCLGYLNVSSALLNFSQAINAAAYLGDAKYAPMVIARGSRKFSPKDLKVLIETNVGNDIGLDSGSGYDKARSVGGVLSTISDKGMILFKKSEQTMRFGTTLVAYDKARAEGKTHDEAIKYAREINRKSNFDYSVADAPNIFRRGSIISQICLQFKKYGFKEAEVVGDMLPGSTKTSKAQKKIFWAMYLLTAGLLQVPLLDWWDKLIGESLYGGKESVQKAIMEAAGDSPLGQVLAKTAMYGIVSNIGIDISKRTGLADVVPTKWSDLAGPAPSKIFSFINDVAAGNKANAIRDVSPGIYNQYAAWIAGHSESGRNRTTATYDDTYSKILRSMGFSSTDERMASDIQQIMYKEREKLKAQKQKAIDDFIADPSNENAKKLKELGVKPSTVKKERARKKADRLNRMRVDMSKKDQKQYKKMFDFAEDEED